jgi:hypothetical protein
MSTDNDRLLTGVFMLVILMIVVCLIVLIGDYATAGWRQDWGVVRDLQYEPARTYLSTEPVVDAKGNLTTRPVVKTDDEDWIVIVTLEQERNIQSFEVDADVYYGLEIGQSVHVTKWRGGWVGIEWRSDVRLAE